jgi:hypothetical protein
LKPAPGLFSGFRVSSILCRRPEAWAIALAEARRRATSSGRRQHLRRIGDFWIVTEVNA